MKLPDSGRVRGSLMLVRGSEVVVKGQPAHARLLGRLGSTLKLAREQRKLSLADLASKTGVPKTTIHEAEAGGVDLRVSQLVALSKALEVPAFWVIRTAV